MSKESSFPAGRLILSVDTSSSLGGLSLFKDFQLVDEIHWGKEKTHSEFLTFNFSFLLEKNSIDITDIGSIICSHGPGSFTGLRVALNFSKALSYANSIDLYLSPSFRSYIDPEFLRSKPDLRFLVLINAYNNQIYVAEYSVLDSKIVEKIVPETKTPKELSSIYENSTQIIVFGDGYLTYSDDFSEAFIKVVTPQEETRINSSINHVKLLNRDFFSYDNGLELIKSDPLTAEPLYIKKSEAEEKLNLGQLRRHSQRKL